MKIFNSLSLTLSFVLSFIHEKSLSVEFEGGEGREKDEEVSRHFRSLVVWFDRLKATRKTKNIYSHWKFIQFFNLLLHIIHSSPHSSIHNKKDKTINLTRKSMTLIDNDRFSNWENLISVPVFFFFIFLNVNF